MGNTGKQSLLGRVNNSQTEIWNAIEWFIYLGFYIPFNIVQVISRWVVLLALCRGNQYIQLVSRFGTVSCWSLVSNYHLSHRFQGLNCCPLRWEASVLPLHNRGPVMKTLWPDSQTNVNMVDIALEPVAQFLHYVYQSTNALLFWMLLFLSLEKKPRGHVHLATDKTTNTMYLTRSQVYLSEIWQIITKPWNKQQSNRNIIFTIIIYQQKKNIGMSAVGKKTMHVQRWGFYVQFKQPGSDIGDRVPRHFVISGSWTHTQRWQPVIRCHKPCRLHCRATTDLSLAKVIH